MDNHLLDSDGPDYDPEAYAEGIDLLRKADKERGGDAGGNPDVAGSDRPDFRGDRGGDDGDRLRDRESVNDA